MKSNIPAILFAVAILAGSALLGKAYKDRGKVDGKIRVTGLGQSDFTSDLIVWEGSFDAMKRDIKEAYSALEEKKDAISAYLERQSVSSEEIIYSAVRTSTENKSIYNDKGDYIGTEFVGYRLSQTVQIESADVNKIEEVSRDITQLLNEGVQLYSEAPRYYYTKMADLKIEMISKATEDARIRAETIAEQSGGGLADLESAKMGVFQITGQNSKEDYSWGGTYNTSSKEKTASITMKLVYEVE